MNRSAKRRSRTQLSLIFYKSSARDHTHVTPRGAQSGNCAAPAYLSSEIRFSVCVYLLPVLRHKQKHAGKEKQKGENDAGVNTNRAVRRRSAALIAS